MRPLRLSALVAAIVSSVGALAQPYVIDSFDVDIELASFGRMTVEERIEVTFNEPRRGIFRFIPVEYETGRGTSRRVFLSGVTVTDERGDGLTTKITHEGPNLMIRIGDADTWLPSGSKRIYVIRYSAEGMLNWFDASTDWEPNAELYWNLTGDQWDTVIRSARFSVRFPKSEGGKGVRARLFAGPYGSRAHDTLVSPGANVLGTETQTVLSLAEDRFSGVLAVPLEPYTGLTLVLSVPSNLIPKPSVGKQLLWFLLPNLGFTLPLWIIGAMTLLWFRFGRDPEEGPVAVQFDPPDGMTGSEAGTLLDERADTRDLASGIVSLAVKGHLTIHPKEEGLIFKRRTADLKLTEKKDTSGLTAFERKLLSKLASGGSTIDESDLRTHVAPHVGELRNALYDSLVQRGYYLKSPDTVRIWWIIGGIAVVILLAIFFSVISPFGNTFPSILGGAVSVILVAVFSKGMPRRTQLGAVARRQARGFEEFIRRARSPELNWLAEKHPDQATFEAFLPHAVAFGLVREWARAFEGIVQEMPSWYVVPGGTRFSPYDFSSDFGAITSSVGAAAATPPRSSGGSGGSSGFSSGGGFSGGGFGGGGGGSW